jgi:uncharacterized membrane protein YoaK (UPF0700 family)
MHSVRHRLPRESGVRDALLIALTVASGAVDAVSWLGLGGFSAFMTGNMALLGFRAGGAAGPPVGRLLAALVAFSLGAAVAARLLRGTRNDGEVWPRRVTHALFFVLVAQAAFLGVWTSVGGHPASGVSNLLIALSALAMGMQTAAVSSLGLRGVFTTAATATLTIFMGDVSGWPRSSGERRRLAGVLVGLFAGAVVGGALVVHAPSWAPVFPLTVTAVVVAASLSFRNWKSTAHRPGRNSRQGSGALRHTRFPARLSTTLSTTWEQGAQARQGDTSDGGPTVTDR